MSDRAAPADQEEPAVPALADSLQAGSARFVRSLGYIILAKVNPAAARALDLRDVPQEPSDEAPRPPRPRPDSNGCLGA
jgi:hypothetical protein